ncbi:hypothetical protein [Rhizobium sp. C4]|uniref:hypothetical protein n=1 Tax=Rhizobium sp. C4 TaxID=1349800 RepID=UPI001E58ABF8|nr:hypothetical protein [Rhizobium sp. C4]MCD2171643.1 hypothetical protein [Rhizobium sp. C4]
MRNSLTAIGAMTFAALITTVGSAEVANAKMTKQAEAATSSMSATSPTDAAIRASNGADFLVVGVSSLPKAEAAFIKETSSESQLKAIQATISANPMLVKKLTAQNVEVKEITGATKAADGSLVFYTM